MAELSIAAIRSRAMVRNSVGASRVDRLSYVKVGSVKIIFTKLCRRARIKRRAYVTAAPMRFALAKSLRVQTGQSDEHPP